MKKSLVWCLVAAMGVAAGGYRVSFAAGPISVPIAAQESASQEQAATEKPAPAQSKADAFSPPPALAVAPFNAEQAKRHQEAWATHLGLPVELTNSIGMKFVLIPPGEFMMGEGLSETYARTTDELPVHRVRITQPFYLGIYEVTHSQYKRVMGKSPSPYEGLQYPVDGVAWRDASQFCEVLSSLPEEKAAGRTYRLPTEAQWEYTCRAGTTTTYHFGNNASVLHNNFAWFVLAGIPGPFERKPDTVHPVGQKRPNAWGLYDMHGNVWEWCRDWYDGSYYKSAPVDDPTGPATGYGRVYRGAGHYGQSAPCRSAQRSGVTPDCQRRELGFRVAAVLSAGKASDTKSDGP